MDSFGIGSAMKGMIGMYRAGATRTGRTTKMVHALRSGDRVIFSNRQEADAVKRRCKDLGLHIECLVIDPKDPYGPHDLRRLERPKSRTIFDHTWVEEFYEQALYAAGECIERLEEKLSGPQSDPRIDDAWTRAYHTRNHGTRKERKTEPTSLGELYPGGCQLEGLALLGDLIIKTKGTAGKKP